jgi:hypothetical protein
VDPFRLIRHTGAVLIAAVVAAGVIVLITDLRQFLVDAVAGLALFVGGVAVGLPYGSSCPLSGALSGSV